MGNSEVVKMFNCQSGAQETIDAQFNEMKSLKPDSLKR